MTMALLSVSGANKSAVLGDLQEYVTETCRYTGMPDILATDYTIESVMAMMGDTGGTATLLLDEMKKVKAVDEYKGGKQGSGNEKLMELQSGQKFRQIRKGSSTPAQSDDTNGTPERSSIRVIEAKSHLNIAGCTHVHTGCKWFKDEEGSTDGKMTRFDCCVVDAAYEDLPDRKVMESLSEKMAEGMDLFVIFVLVRALREIFVAEYQGNILLDDYAYKELQRVIKDLINPSLNVLKSEPLAGAQTSSWSKLKGKIVKLSGCLFMLSEAAKLAEEEEIQSFDFDTSSFEELVEIVRDLSPHLERVTDGKIITFEALEFATQWAFMFHDTGLALQHCMVPRLHLPVLSRRTTTTERVGPDDDTLSDVSADSSASVKIRKRRDFATALEWATHIVLTSPKFEDRIVSASYMTAYNRARLNIGSVDCALVPEKPTFTDVAKHLEELQLATIIWLPDSKRKRKAGDPPKIWGLQLVDFQALLNDEAGSLSAALSQVLTAFALTVPEFLQHCKAMTPTVRDTFKHADLEKYMQMPPPFALARPSILSPEQRGLSQGKGGMSAEEGESLEAALFLSSAAPSPDQRRSPRILGSPPGPGLSSSTNSPLVQSRVAEQLSSAATTPAVTAPVTSAALIIAADSSTGVADVPTSAPSSGIFSRLFTR